LKDQIEPNNPYSFINFLPPPKLKHIRVLNSPLKEIVRM